MAIQHRRGNFADFDPYKMRPGEWAFPLDRGEGYYCISPGDVRRVATKEEIIEILETSQDAYNKLQQILTELEDGTGATGIINDIMNLQIDLGSLTTDFNTHLTDKANPHNTNKTHVGLGNVDNVKQMPISGGVLENYREKLITLSGTTVAINLNLGNVFTHSTTGNTTYSITNAVAGQAHSFTLIINQPATVNTLTFPTSVKWQGGEIPNLSNANKTYVLTFMTIDGGTTWLGMFGGEF